ncbi:hypothetical protein ACFL1B_00795 [Nanoarchaeota archaeon]
MADTKETAGQSKDEQIGFHKGSLSTLSKERAEMVRILGIVEQLMQMHIASLKELGIDLEQEAEKLMEEQDATKKAKKPIEDII